MSQAKKFARGLARSSGPHDPAIEESRLKFACDGVPKQELGDVVFDGGDRVRLTLKQRSQTPMPGAAM